MKYNGTFSRLRRRKRLLVIFESQKKISSIDYYIHVFNNMLIQIKGIDLKYSHDTH
jgi:hypothetical protein